MAKLVVKVEKVGSGVSLWSEEFDSSRAEDAGAAVRTAVADAHEVSVTTSSSPGAESAQFRTNCHPDGDFMVLITAHPGADLCGILRRALRRAEDMPRNDE